MTDTDDKELELSFYGKDAEDWLSRWDQGQGVWSIEMGGLSPGYEQSIQIVAAEVLRWMIANKPDMESKWHLSGGDMCKHVSKTIEYLNITGAQWGAAVSLASCLYTQGPCKLVEGNKDRKIQVSKGFPQPPTPPQETQK